MMTKAEIRKTLLTQRAMAHAREGTGLLDPMAAWLRSKMRPEDVLGSYNPIRTERDPAPLHTKISAPLAFPRVIAADQPLGFFSVGNKNDFEPGSFGVLEPRITLPQVIPDVILVPLVGFDRAGFRLGYGGGFYDRTLAQFRSIKPIFSVGFSYDGQLSNQALNFEKTDLALDAIITPTRRYEFENATCQEYIWS